MEFREGVQEFLFPDPVYPLPENSLAAATVSSSEFTADAGFSVTPDWDINLGFSYAKAKLDNALIPCNDGNFDGVVDTIVPSAQAFVDNGVLVARCISNESISRTPKWNVTAQSEYRVPLSPAMDGFLRGNFVYYPDNPNSSQGYDLKQRLGHTDIKVAQQYIHADRTSERRIAEAIDRKKICALPFVNEVARQDGRV